MLPMIIEIYQPKHKGVSTSKKSYGQSSMAFDSIMIIKHAKYTTLNNELYAQSWIRIPKELSENSVSKQQEVKKWAEN